MEKFDFNEKSKPEKRSVRFQDTDMSEHPQQKFPKLSAGVKTQFSRDLRSDIPSVKTRALQCIQIATMASYAYSMAKKATEKALEARARAHSSSELAHKLSEAVEVLKKNAQIAAEPFFNDHESLVRLYVSAERKPITFYKFMTIIKPTEDMDYYDKEDDNSEGSKLQTSTSSESCDAFNLPQIKKIKSMSEEEFSGNIISISDQRRKMKTIKPTRSVSPLLRKEDADNVKKKTSPSTSQHSGLSQLHKYSIRASPSSKSLSTLKSDL